MNVLTNEHEAEKLAKKIKCMSDIKQYQAIYGNGSYTRQTKYKSKKEHIMAKYHIDYKISHGIEEVEKAIVEASSLSAAKKALKKYYKEEYGDFYKVKFNDAYLTSDDAQPYLPMTKTKKCKLITSLKNMFRKNKPIQVTSMTQAEWEDILLKLEVLDIGVVIDCDDCRKSRKHYIKNIPKVIDPQKTIFDMTNYPGYVIIHMSNNDDLYTLCETYNNIYRLYGEVTKIELLPGFFYREKDSDEPTNEIQFSLKELPISFTDFNQIIDSRYR